MTNVTSVTMELRKLMEESDLWKDNIKDILTLAHFDLREIQVDTKDGRHYWLGIMNNRLRYAYCRTENGREYDLFNYLINGEVVFQNNAQYVGDIDDAIVASSVLTYIEKDLTDDRCFNLVQ